MVYARPNDAVRLRILQYLYERNDNATSARGKRGAAVKIGDMRRDLKRLHGLTREQVVSNLRYLISQGWIEEQEQQRVVPVDTGRQIPSVTVYYAITAAGIDRIEGDSDFTPRERFAGIQITATGQSTVMVGDGNQINSKYEREGESLAELGLRIKEADSLGMEAKMNAVADIDTIQAQLSKATPNSVVVTSAWQSLKSLVVGEDVAPLLRSVGELLGQLIL